MTEENIRIIPVNKNGIARIEVQPIGFKRLVEISGSVPAGSNDSEGEKHINRKRMLAQAKAFDEAGFEKALTEADILALPTKTGIALQSLLNIREENENDPKIISEGDGIESPILIKLGRPIQTQKGPINELEFLAETFGAIENVIAETKLGNQVLALIEHVGKPISDDVSLQRLPSWGLDQISLADGSFIAKHVLERFLE